MKSYILIALGFISSFAFAQQHRCGTNEYRKQEELKNPLIKKTREKSEQEKRLFIIANPYYRISQTVIIPVVVHVLYNNADQNVADSKIREQIDVLNNDYARNNQDAASTPSPFQSIASNCGIQFCLAKRDPNGKPTTGIERKFTSLAEYSIGDDMKHSSTGGLDAWPADDYLNLWICNFESSLLGFATFPGSAPATDGVVIYYAAVGGPDQIGSSNSYNLGRTVTHEVGHWLGLYHIWGDDGGLCTGSDYINDTPNQAKEHYGTPSFPYISCDNGPNGDMFMNFMDYTDDFFMNMFSAGQATAMNIVLQNDRFPLVSSSGCVVPSALPLDASVEIQSPTAVLCTNDLVATIILRNSGTSNIVSSKIKYNVDDDTVQTYNWTGILASGAVDTIKLTALTAVEGIHNLIVQCTLVNGVVDGNTSNNISVQEFTTSAFTFGLPLKEDFESKLFPQQAWSIANPDNGATWMRTALAANGGEASLWINGIPGTADGSEDEMTIQPLNVSNVSEPILAFDVAYQYDNANTGTHSLQVLASNDCGKTFSVIYDRSNEELKTADGNQNPFIPTSVQWRKDTVSLKNFAGTTSLLLKFKNMSGNANGLYIDNINIGSIKDIFPDAENINFTVNPNPSNGILNFTLRLLESSSATLRIFNATGQKVFEKKYETTDANEVLNLTKLRSGLYSVQVVTDGDKKAKKIVIN